MNPTPSHWTYEVIEDNRLDLYQGDILVPTEELQALLKDVHKHFVDPKYLGFIITTQSCDLVLRGGKCKAAHINLAVIKSLEDTLADYLDYYCKKVHEGIYTKESKQEAKKLLTRILNQNEEKLGLFYVHPEPSLEIGEPAVAILRVSIALKNEHYELLKSARRGRLTSEFRNKLGWLVGNLYSRAATIDWYEKKQTAAMNDIIKNLLKDAVCHWPSQAAANSVQHAGAGTGSMDLESIKKVLQSYEPRPLKDEIAETAKEILQGIATGIDPQVADKFESRFKNDPKISQILKYYQSVMSVSAEESEIPPDFL